MNDTSSLLKATRTFWKLLLTGVLGYVLGGLTVHLNWFPVEQIKSLETSVMGSTLMEPTPRSALFRAFSPKADVVMIGDSITSAGEWSEIFPAIKISNRGISGETAEDILERMDSIFAVHPRKAFVMVGINDIYDGQSINKIFTNYTSIVRQLQEKGITVYIQSTIECSVDRCGDRIHKVRELNQRLQTYASSNNLTFIDLNSKLSSEKQGLLNDFTYDGMHLSANGFIQWRDLIAPHVN